MNGVDITKAPGAGFVNPFVGLISFLIDNHLIFFLSIYVSLGGCYRWNFIPDARGMKWSVSIVKSSMSLTVYTFFQRWSFIPVKIQRGKTGMKFHPRIKKSRLSTSCRDEILQQTCFYLFFDACTICLSALTDLNINKVRRKIL